MDNLGINIRPHSLKSIFKSYSYSHSQLSLASSKSMQVSKVQSQNIIKLIQSVVSKYPNKIAVKDKNLAITYKQIAFAAQKMAKYLVKQKSLKHKDIVIISVEPSINYIIAILATVYAGGIYLPVTDKQLKNNLNILKSKQIKLIVGSKSSANIDLPRYIEYLNVSALKYKDAEPLDFTSVASLDNDIVTLTKTSGTTSEPRLVEVTHQNIVNLANNKIFDINSYDVLLHHSNPSFDASLFEIWGALLNGAQINILENQILLNPTDLKLYLQKENISILWLTSSLFNNLFKQSPNIFDGINDLYLGGEALNYNLIKRLYNQKLRPKNIYNAYGPTENTTFSLIHKIDDSSFSTSSIPIGKPLENVKALVLNEKQMPVSKGEKGELYLGGENLTKGYYHNSELTKTRFIQYFDAKTAVSEVLYKTGDLVCYDDNQNLLFLGRKDNIIKIRGYRVDLQYLEEQINLFPHINNAKVLVKNGQSLGKYLICYYTANTGHTIKINYLREFLRERVDARIIPNFFISLESMPLTKNGKLDLKKLANINQFNSSIQKVQTLENDPTKLKLTTIFKKLLEIEVVNVTDDFFELGGHSLLVLRLLSEIEDAFEIQLTIQDLYSYRTVEALALKLKSKKSETKNTPLIKLKEGDENSPPIFMLHPIGGTSFCYLPLVKNLHTDKSIYAFQDPVIDNLKADFSTLDEMALAYIKYMKKVQPYGPYYLVGASFGASMVIAMTHQLEKMGEKVNCAALIDGFAKFKVHHHKYNKSQENYLKALKNLMPNHVDSNSPFFNVLCERLEMLLKYELPKINTPLILFKANEVLPKFKKMDSKDNGWNRYSSFPIKIHCVPGNHETMLTDPNVPALAHELESYISFVSTESNKKAS